MKLKVYREATNQITGRGAGDDALPYLGNRLISVADGSSALAYYYHPDINEMLFDRDKSFDVAVEGIIDKNDPMRETLKQQYCENFFREGYDLSKDYANTSGRKSSYFGSRLASIFMRWELESRFSNEDLEALFDELNEMDYDRRTQKLEELGKEFASRLQERLAIAANNCKINCKPGIDSNSIRLMATTYSGILFLERADYLDVLTIQAGDSLPWAFVCTGNGLELRLLQEPHSRADGGIYNEVWADAPFTFTCSSQRINKPCVLLCGSDGCFDAYGLDNPAQFEYFMLGVLKKMNREGPDAVEKELSYFFSTKSSDDSSSMVLITFDLPSDINTRIQQRAELLKTEMKLANAEIYSEDNPPEERLRQYEARRNQILVGFAEKFWDESEWIRSQYLEKEEISSILEQYSTEIEQLEGIRIALESDLKQYVTDNWEYIQSDIKDPSRAVYKIKNLGKNIKASEAKYQRNANEKVLPEEQFIELQKQYLDIIGSINFQDAENEDNPKSYFDASFENARVKLIRMRKVVEEWCREQREVKHYKAEMEISRKQLYEQDKILIDLYCLVLERIIPSPNTSISAGEYMHMLYRELHFGNEEIDEIKLRANEVFRVLKQLPDSYDVKNDNIAKKLNAIYDIEKRISNLLLLKDEKKIEEQQKKVYLERPMKPIVTCYKEHIDTLSDEFKKEITQSLAQVEDKYQSLEGIVQDKNRMFEKYEENYKELLL